MEEGDACIFELIDPNPGTLVFKVHIFRVVELKYGQCGLDDWQNHYHLLIRRGLIQDGPGSGPGIAIDPLPLSHKVERERERVFQKQI